MMSNQNDTATLHHALKDIERQLKKNADQITWVLMASVASLAVSLITFMITAAK